MAKAAVRGMAGLRWNRGSWDFALFEKRYRVGIALEERPPDSNVRAVVVVRDDDTAATLASRVRQVLAEAGWGKRPKPRGGSGRDEDEDEIDDP